MIDPGPAEAIVPPVAGGGFIYESSGFHGVVIFAGSSAAIGAVAAIVLRAVPSGG